MSQNKSSDISETLCVILIMYSIPWHLVQPELCVQAFELDNTKILTYTFFNGRLATKK